MVAVARLRTWRDTQRYIDDLLPALDLACVDLIARRETLEAVLATVARKG